MDLINDVDFIFPLCRGIGHFLPDLTDMVHTIVGRRIYLNDIHGTAGCNGFAGSTFPAGTAVLWLLTINRFGKDLRNRRLAGSSGAAEQIGMSDTVRQDLVLQCCYDMILPFDILKF